MVSYKVHWTLLNSLNFVKCGLRCQFGQGKDKNVFL